MGRVSIGQPHPRPCSGKKPLKNCRSSENNENVVFIDVDSENSENVIILDSPEPFPRKSSRSSVFRKDKGVVFQNVIHLDDDETPDDQQPGAVGNDNGNHADPSTSRNVGKENVTPVRLSKCKRTYSGKASTRSHYGLLNVDSDSDASDGDDNFDSDIMVDISGTVQEQWEKAFLRRNNNGNNRQSGVENRASTSQGISGNNRQCGVENRASTSQGINGNNHQSGVEKRASTSQGINGNQDQHVETQGEINLAKQGFFTSSTNKSSYQNGTSSSRMKENADTHYRNVVLIPDDIYDCSLDSLLRSHLRDIENMSQANDSTFIDTKLDEHQDCKSGGSRRPVEEKQENPSAPDPAHQEHSTKAVDRTSPACKNDRVPVEHPTKSAPLFDDSHHDNGCSVKDETTMPKCQNSFQSRVDLGSQNQDSTKASESHATGSNEEPFKRSTSPIRKNNDALSPTSGPGESVPGETSSAGKTCIINVREKLKETDEFKRAAEEELASRQNALRIQSEEAQNLRRLRKRSKAESMRALDMERRQKQRLEEIRDSKKKDEENMNLKEVIRAEIRKDLQKLEISCHDMSSLLHSLGISVSSWPNPSQQEVQTAYKKALLTFHPDRASRCDIRKQVEAEEKFKLVNRLKEKFLPSLLH